MSHLHRVWSFQGSGQQARGQPREQRFPGDGSGHGSSNSSSRGWGGVWWGARWVSPSSLSLQKQGDGRGSSSQQRDSMVMPCLSHVHSIDLQGHTQVREGKQDK